MKIRPTAYQWNKFKFAAKVVKMSVDGIKSNEHENCETTREYFAEMFAQLIFKCPKLRSGLISNAGRLQKTSKKDATADHYRGRKGSGFALYDQAMKGASIERLTTLLASRSRVHLVSKQENMRLREYASQNPYKSKRQIEKEYLDLGIILFEFIAKKPRKYDYHIEGVIYTSVKEVKKLFNISTDCLTGRCKSKNYPDWQRLKIT
jgi:hypothetical protein